MTFLRRLYSPEALVKPSLRCGDLPSAKSAYKLALNVALPAVIESVLVTLVSMVDTMMVGVLGPKAIAAVGLTTQPRFIVLAMFFSLNIAIVAIVARRKGENDRDGANSTMMHGIILAGALCVVLCVIATVFARQFMLLAGAEADAIEDSMAYFRIILIGLPFQVIGLVITSAHRGAGNTRISMRTNLIANGVNVVFNYLLIGGNLGFPKLGVSGAAIATSIGYVVAFVISLLSVRKPNGFLFISLKKRFKFDKKILGGIFGIGASAATEQVCLRIGFLMYARIIAGLGTISFAAHQICLSLNLFFAISDGFGIAASSLVGQSLGKLRADLATLYIKVCQRISTCFVVVVGIIYIVFAEQIVRLFTDDTQVIAFAAPVVILLALTGPFQTSQVIIGSALRGAGDTKVVAVISFISILLMRPIIAWTLCYAAGLGLLGGWMSMTIDNVLRLVMLLIRMGTGKWMKIKV